MTQLRAIPFDSEAYQRVLALRDEVLRRPLGLSVFDEDIESEKRQQAFGLFSGEEELLACLMVVPLDPGHVKLRQMAVAPSRQGEGLGRSLIIQVEALLRRRQVQQVTLHARCSAADFYRKLGYTVDDAPFTEVGIPHVKMTRQISD